MNATFLQLDDIIIIVRIIMNLYSAFRSGDTEALDMRKRGLCCHAVSVCLSVCLSAQFAVTFVYCVKTSML